MKVEKEDGIGLILCSSFMTELFQLKRFEMVERNQIDKLIQERDFQ